MVDETDNLPLWTEEDLLDEEPTDHAYEGFLKEADDPLDTGRVATDDEIIRKYDEGQASIIIQRNDLLIPNILEMVKSRQILDLSPQYQRRFRWTRKKQSQLIESLLMNIPMPPIFLYEKDLAQYEVMDGQQRLTTIRSFFQDEFRLSNLTIWKELNGRKFSKLPPRIQAGLKRRGLSVVIILTESGRNTDEGLAVRQYVFERLNTGGQPLNPQEVRNCIYSGQFNSLLVEISRSDLFTSMWGIPKKEADESIKPSKTLRSNKIYATMADCAIVLRFFALSDMQTFTGMRKTLDDCMKRLRHITPEVRRTLEASYMRTLQTVSDIFGDESFKIYNETRTIRGQKSVPYSDAIMFATKQFEAHSQILIENRAQIQTDLLNLMTDDSIYDALIGSKNSKQEILDRIRYVSEVYQKAIEGA